MKATLFLPYEIIESQKKNIENAYATEQDYINALKSEYDSNTDIIMNNFSQDNDGNTSFRTRDFSENDKTYHFNEKTPQNENKMAYAQSEVIIYNAAAAEEETIDSIVDKFAAQNEFAITFRMDDMQTDAEFEEELRIWWEETDKINKYGKELASHEGQQTADDWIDKYIPRRDLKMSFTNKAKRNVTFLMQKCEIMKKYDRNTYCMYVNQMFLEK
jgi:hypothetical protein